MPPLLLALTFLNTVKCIPLRKRWEIQSHPALRHTVPTSETAHQPHSIITHRHPLTVQDSPHEYTPYTQDTKSGTWTS